MIALFLYLFLVTTPVDSSRSLAGTYECKYEKSSIVKKGPTTGWTRFHERMYITLVLKPDSTFTEVRCNFQCFADPGDYTGAWSVEGNEISLHRKACLRYSDTGYRKDYMLPIEDSLQTVSICSGDSLAYRLWKDKYTLKKIK